MKRVDDRRSLSPFEKALILASALATLALFGYLAYEAATTPSAAMPAVAVEPAEGGAWVVLSNDGGRGIADALISVTCGGSELEISFTNVPAASERRAFVACDAGAVEATLAWWIEA